MAISAITGIRTRVLSVIGRTRYFCTTQELQPPFLCNTVFTYSLHAGFLNLFSEPVALRKDAVGLASLVVSNSCLHFFWYLNVNSSSFFQVIHHFCKEIMWLFLNVVTWQAESFKNNRAALVVYHDRDALGSWRIGVVSWTSSGSGRRSTRDTGDIWGESPSVSTHFNTHLFFPSLNVLMQAVYCCHGDRSQFTTCWEST